MPARISQRSLRTCSRATLIAHVLSAVLTMLEHSHAGCVTGEIAVQRQLTQLRVDYLGQLNTQTTLIAGMAAAMLGSLELEAIQPEATEHHHELRRSESMQMVLTLLYVCGACTVLGVSARPSTHQHKASRTPYSRSLAAQVIC